MKHLRIFILLLLAVLLPVRGAVAATMPCPQAGGPGPAAVAAVHEHHDMPAEHAPAHHHASGDAPDDDSPSGDHPTPCSFCASGGCMASMVETMPSPGQPSLTSSVTFPALTAPVPAFQSGGQERPPRTI